jgi:hypothetical protein
MAKTFVPYLTTDEVRDVVQRFESCDFPPGGFHHSHHITVALFYLLEHSEKEATAKIREGLLRFLEFHGSPDAYHETITVFWIKRVRYLLEQDEKSKSLFELANSIVALCSDPQIINHYFTAERLASEEARRSWTEPDLRPPS